MSNNYSNTAQETTLSASVSGVAMWALVPALLTARIRPIEVLRGE